MSIFDHRRHRQTQLLGPQRPLLSILGSGKVSELVLWKKKKESVGMIAGFTAIWFLFEVFEYHFITLLSHLLIIIMLLLFFWKNLALLANWDPPSIHKVEISESTFRHLFDKFNWLLFNFFQVSYGDDFKLFLMAIASLWLISVIGGLTSSLNLIYIGLQILPVLYERYETKVEEIRKVAKSFMETCFHILDSHVLSKIPRASIKRSD